MEDDDALAALRGVGGDLSQGYLHARPLPEPRFRAWCEERGVMATGAAAHYGI